MAEQRWFDGYWYRSPASLSFCYVPAGFYDPSQFPPSTTVLTDMEVLTLVPVLEREGFLKPRLDDRLRQEDLKITHRLLDLLARTVAK